MPVLTSVSGYCISVGTQIPMPNSVFLTAFQVSFLGALPKCTHTYLSYSLFTEVPRKHQSESREMRQGREESQCRVHSLVGYSDV